MMATVVNLTRVLAKILTLMYFLICLQQTSSADISPECSEEFIRLVNGTNNSEGRVEFCNDGQWGTVCDNIWTTFDAQVVCRELGFSTTGAMNVSRAGFGAGNHTSLHGVTCNGTESRLDSCQQLFLDCNHSQYAVGVKCPVTCTHGDIRLVNGTNSSEGQVQFCNGGRWGTVCDTDWTTLDAQVVCRGLGFSTIGAMAITQEATEALFVQIIGPIWYYNTTCSGTEARFDDCPANFTQSFCLFAGVRCPGSGIPSAIDHVNDVSVKLVSLDSVNITWRIPSDNNVSITSYTLIFCVSPNDTDCSHSSAINVTRQVDDLTRISENRLSYIFPELVTEKLYEIVIRAENSNGLQMAPELGNGFRFNSASADDGQVVNVSFIPTTRMIIVTWNLPALAMATANLNVSFDVLYYSDADQQNITTVPVQYNMSRPEQGVSVDLMIANSSTHVFKIQARYINPNLSSSQANLTGVRTLANDSTLLTGPQAVVNNTIGPGDALTLSWPAPINTNFLVNYSVSYFTRSVQGRSPTSTVEVPAVMTSTTLPFAVFTTYTVSVYAIYAPPDGNRVTVNLLPPTMFTTQERRTMNINNTPTITHTVTMDTCTRATNSSGGTQTLIAHSSDTDTVCIVSISFLAVALVVTIAALVITTFIVLAKNGVKRKVTYDLPQNNNKKGERNIHVKTVHKDNNEPLPTVSVVGTKREERNIYVEAVHKENIELLPTVHVEGVHKDIEPLPTVHVEAVYKEDIEPLPTVSVVGTIA